VNSEGVKVRVDRAHKKLDVWREGVELATLIYKVTEIFPKYEIYGLTSQMRRAVVSVPSNIAEGAARFSAKEFAQFLNIAGGSLSELDTQLEIALNLKYISTAQKNEIDSKIDFISAKLAGLIRNVRNKR
jgi:four helix bundle protein